MEGFERTLSTYLEKWRDILRLGDWEIKPELVTRPWRKTGDVKIDAHGKTAILLINACDPKQTNMEEVVVHELMHVKLYGMDQMIESLLHGLYGEDERDPKFAFAYGQFMDMLETTAQDLTRSLVHLGADDKSPSFGRIQRQADDEWREQGTASGGPRL